MINTMEEFKKLEISSKNRYSDFIRNKIRSKKIKDFKIEYVKVENAVRPMQVFYMPKKSWDKVKEGIK